MKTARMIAVVAAALLLVGVGPALAQAPTEIPTPTPTPTEPTPTPTPTPTEPTPTPTPTATATATATPTPTPTVDPEPIIQQVSSEMAPLPKVFDVTNPAIVFSQLKEGVDAWRATLGGATDEWGNVISEGYVAARRPDVVNEQLIQFLVNYYKDKGVVLVAGKDKVLTTIQAMQDDYNKRILDEVLKRIKEKEEELAQEASNNTSTPEDVPTLPPTDPTTTPTDPTTSTIQITSLSSNEIVAAAAGGTLTINGTGFGAGTADNTVSLSTSPEALSVISASATALTVQYGPGIVAGDPAQITVRCGDQTSNEYQITVKPSITRVSPATPIASAPFDICGYGFASDAAAVSVSVGGQTTTPVQIGANGGSTEDQIRINSPVTTPGMVDIVVTINGAASASYPVSLGQ